jgi:inositol-pentakisphosphate 2-kinase
MSLKVLPSAIDLTYLAEGAANVVYKISGQSSSSHVNADQEQSSMQGKLLRLKKDIPSRVPVKESFESFKDKIEGLFPSIHLVEQDLITVPIITIENCNQRLLQDEKSGKRSRKRCGSYIARDEAQGLLITDMSPNRIKGEVLIEFKPKWLSQSPSAPSNAIRCRTCALRARMNSSLKAKGQPETSSFCPVDLAAVGSRKERAIRFIVRKAVAGTEVESLVARVMTAIKKTRVLDHLRHLQTQYDSKGILESDAQSLDFRLSMTLRDCTLFIKVW